MPPIPISDSEHASVGSQEFDTAYPLRQQVQVWREGSATLLHAVRINGAQTSLSGVPYTQKPECDSCRVSYPLAAIDSVRTGNHETTGIVLAVIPFVALGAALFVLRLGMDGD